MPSVNKILLVGELNPYGADPEFALYPLPEHASGARLKALLNLSLGDYLKKHDRVNLCSGMWDSRAAAEHAQRLHAGRLDGTGIVLLGAKVAQAFRSAAAYPDSTFAPFALEQHQTIWYLSLPHPSGRNRVWNNPQAAVKALWAYEELRERVGLKLGTASRPQC